MPLSADNPPQPDPSGRETDPRRAVASPMPSADLVGPSRVGNLLKAFVVLGTVVGVMIALLMSLQRMAWGDGENAPPPGDGAMVDGGIADGSTSDPVPR